MNNNKKTTCDNEGPGPPGKGDLPPDTSLACNFSALAGLSTVAMSPGFGEELAQKVGSWLRRWGAGLGLRSSA